jgi:hypothetical protein
MTEQNMNEETLINSNTVESEINNEDSNQSSEENDSIKRLIEESLNQKIQELENKLKNTLEQVDKKNSGLASSIKKQMQKEETKNQEQQNLTLKSLQQELNSLKDELQNKERAISEDKRNNYVKDYLRDKLDNKAVIPAMKLFINDYSKNISEYEGNWYYEKDEKVVSLKDKLEEFLKSEEGEIFLNSSKKYKGVGIKPSNATPPNKASNISLNEALFMPD